MKKLQTTILNLRNAIIWIAIIILFLTGCNKRTQKATLVLPVNTSAGYNWKVQQSVAIFDIESEREEDHEYLGNGGTETYVLTPKQSGATQLDFHYSSFAHEEYGIDTMLTYVLKVNENMEITVESKECKKSGHMSGLADAPEIVIE